MKRTVLSVFLIVSLIFFYIGWIDVETPTQISELNNDLDQHALAYEVIDGTPLIVASFGGTIFLDTLRLERVSMNIPPLPQWQWTGMWVRVSDWNAGATAQISVDFGPRVIFGVINNDRIVGMHIVRDGEVISTHQLEGSGYIVHAPDVLPSDEIEFVDADGNVVTRSGLRHIGEEQVEWYTGMPEK